MIPGIGATMSNNIVGPAMGNFDPGLLQKLLPESIPPEDNALLDAHQ